MIPTRCQHCGTGLRRTGGGRPPTYCSGRCRVAAHRARRVPAALAERARWVRYSAGKVPLQAANGRNASSTAPPTWSSHANAASSTHGVGMGFVLNGDGIVCLDLDHCLEGGRLAGWACEILHACPRTYVEVSPSGTGLHIWGRGEVGTARRIRDHRTVEVYGQGRFITVTGQRYQAAPLQLADLSGVLESLH